MKLSKVTSNQYLWDYRIIMGHAHTIAIVCALFIAIAIVYYIARQPLSEGYSNTTSDMIIQRIKANFAAINPAYGNIPVHEGSKSETINKSDIYLCLRDPKTGQYYDLNTISYVSIHELAHVLSKGYVSDSDGHGHVDNPEFMATLTELLHRAVALGIYNPSIPQPPVYCGVMNH